MAEIRKRKILVMDDDEVIRAAIQGLLETLDYEVETCRDGRNAIQLYKQAYDNSVPFDAVVLDLNVPDGMGGRKTMKELLKIDPSAKGIVSTGFGNDEVMSDFRNYGFCNAVEKPYKIEVLDKKLSDLINEKRQ